MNSMTINLRKRKLVLLGILPAFFATSAVLAIWLSEGPLDNGQIVPARLVARGESVPFLVNCREIPLKISSKTKLIDAASEVDLVTVLCGALPWWSPPSVPSAIHELKLWGRTFVFTKEMLGADRSGEHLVRMLLSDKVCRANSAPVGGTYLLDSPFGIRPVLIGSEDAIEYRGEGHYGQLLQVLGEVGVSSTTSVTTSSGKVGTVADLFQDAVMQFSFSHELEFIGCSLAYWLPPQKTWKNQFGVEYNFDQLLTKLIATPYGEGPCGGTHVPYSVVTILRADEQHSILSDPVRHEARKWLMKLAHALEIRWSKQGTWNITSSEKNKPTFLWGDDVLDRITISGHHLEWMALATDELRPSETTIKRVVLDLRKDIEALPPLHGRTFKSLLPISHAGRALAMLRGDDPFFVWHKYWKAGKLKPSEKGFTIQEEHK